MYLISIECALNFRKQILWSEMGSGNGRIYLMFAARITSPKKIEIEDIETPSIGEGQCLIKLERWSVCGSDIRHAYGPVMPEEEYPMRHGGACHECAGTIVESKSDKFKVGQRAVSYTHQTLPTINSVKISVVAESL